MAYTFVGFDSAIKACAEGHIDLDTNTIKLALTNTEPDAATDSIITDITQIAAGNGYTTGGITITVASSSQTAGAYSFVVADITGAWTAGASAMATFRWYVIYDSTTGYLIGYWERAAELSLGAGNSINLDLPATGLITGAWA